MASLFRGPQLSLPSPPIPDFISVIIPVYRDHTGLATTLSSLRLQTLPRDRWEVIVANDGGDPDVSRLCEGLGVEHLDLQPNGGSYFARNRGLECARGEFIAFVDADIAVEPRWLKSGLEALNTADYVAGPVTINPKLVRTYAEHFEQVSAFPVENYLKQRHFGPTANLFVRRVIFETLGGFDERLRSGGDLEFGDRVFRDSRAWRQVFCSELNVIHPPRNLSELKVKYLRVIKGHRTLGLLHPDRFPWAEQRHPLEFLRLLVPPNPWLIWKTFGSSPRYPFPFMYLFCWRMKVLRLMSHWAIQSERE